MLISCKKRKSCYFVLLGTLPRIVPHSRKSTMTMLPIIFESPIHFISLHLSWSFMIYIHICNLLYKCIYYIHAFIIYMYINIYIYIYIYIFFCHMACRILVPWPEIKPVPPAVEVQSCNHWTTRVVPWYIFLNDICI